EVLAQLPVVGDLQAEPELASAVLRGDERAALHAAPRCALVHHDLGEAGHRAVGRDGRGVRRVAALPLVALLALADAGLVPLLALEVELTHRRLLEEHLAEVAVAVD